MSDAPQIGDADNGMLWGDQAERPEEPLLGVESESDTTEDDQLEVEE